MFLKNMSHLFINFMFFRIRVYMYICKNPNSIHFLNKFYSIILALQFLPNVKNLTGDLT